MYSEKEISNRNEKYSRSRKITALALAVPLALNLSACTDETESKPTYPTPAYETLEPLDPAYEKQCAIIPDELIEETEDLYADTWKYEPYDSNVDVDILLQERLSAKLAVAEELNLTLYDYESEFNDLQEDIYGLDNPGVIPIDVYFERVQEFLSRYDVSIEFAGDIDLDDDYGISVPVQHDYSKEQMLTENDIETKIVLYNLVDSFGKLPVELVKTMGMKRIVLTDIDEADDAIGFISPEVLDFDTIFLDHKEGGGIAPVHEMFHLWDMRVCGPVGAWRDPQFEELNPDPAEDNFDFYANTQEYYSEDNAQTLKNQNDLYTKKQIAQSDTEKATIQAEMDAIDSLVVSTRDYGLNNIIEDKATIGEDILGIFSRWSMESVESPILQAKTKLLLARLYSEAPEIVEFFARTNQQSTNTENVLAD